MALSCAIRWSRWSLCGLAVVVCSALDVANGQAVGVAEDAHLPNAHADLSVLAETLLARHPKLQLVTPRQDFLALYRSILPGIDSLPRARAILEFARLAAELHDGHTQLPLFDDPRVAFHRLPLRVYLFSDGVYITRADPPHGRALGKRIMSVGRVPVDTVIARMRPFLHGDNEWSNKDILASRLILVELLDAVGAMKGSAVTLTLADSAGRTDTITVHAREPNSPLPALAVLTVAERLPLYLKHPGVSYWFTPIAGTRAMYSQINAMRSDSAYTFAQYCDSLVRTATAGGYERLIIDLRLNNGGDNSLDDELVHRLIRSERFDRPGHLFVITGRKTFSAAVNLTAELERHTAAITVGEPTAAPANHYGETQVLRLPNSGIVALYSSLYWQSGDPRDHRAAIEPRIRVELPFRAYRNYEDPVVDTIVKRPMTSPD